MVGIVALMLVPLGRVPSGDGAETPDPCEAKAVQAYWQALKLCQLAEAPSPNPRIRCYDAAKSVYFRTLLDCQRCRSSGQEEP
jgi:hypothetical protein